MISEIIKPAVEETPELEKAFQEFLSEIQDFYPASSIKIFLSWHSQESLIEKISEPKRFFRIIRDKKGEIIAYFESKPHSDEETVQVIQWFFVHPKNEE